jgi:putative FmdB family regulatory protein
VPTYEYQCEKCQRVFEVRQRITEPALTTCEVCGGHVKRLLSPAPFILKGEGWYVTDYPSEARKKAKEAEKPAVNGSGKGSDKGSDKGPADKSAADKPAASKSDASPSSSSASTSSGTTGAASPSAPAKND